jgi:hypothetical protein
MSFKIAKNQVREQALGQLTDIRQMNYAQVKYSKNIGVV